MKPSRLKHGYAKLSTTTTTTAAAATTTTKSIYKASVGTILSAIQIIACIIKQHRSTSL